MQIQSIRSNQYGDMRRTIRHKSSSLGMPRGTPRTYSRRYNHLSLGMPEASLLIHQQISGCLVHDLYYSYCPYIIIVCMRTFARIFIVTAILLKFSYDATESYFERGKHGSKYLNSVQYPLFMLKVLKLHLFCLPMLVTLCFNDLFSYKIPMYRNRVRFKCV